MEKKSLNNLRFKSNYSLKKLTTIRIGGPAQFFIKVKNKEELIRSIKWADTNKIKWLVIGAGSNLIPSDKGFNGLIIKNEIKDFRVKGSFVFVGGGNDLLKFIFSVNKLGLGGLEKMAGIPGTVGGAIRGSAGAYGQEIKDQIIRVKIYDRHKVYWLTKKECQFSYRTSIFKKHKHWVILGAEFKLVPEPAKMLNQIARDIIKQRQEKYPSHLLCPGSFFKNIILQEIKPVALREKIITKLPPETIKYGKVAAGYFLEAVGAKGMRVGGIGVADYHGNLIYNLAAGQSSDILKLAKILKDKVKKKFGLDLEEEVQYL